MNNHSVYASSSEGAVEHYTLLRLQRGGSFGEDGLFLVCDDGNERGISFEDGFLACVFLDRQTQREVFS